MHDQRADLNQWLSDHNIELGDTAFEKVFSRTTEIAARTGAVSNEQVGSIVEEVVSGMEVLDEVAASFR